MAMIEGDDDRSASLPFNPTHPHDTLQYGLSSFKQEALPVHPLQALQAKIDKQHRQTKRSLLEKVYGSAVPMRMDIDKQILSRFQRPPGLPSSMLGLESLTGELDEFGFEDYLNDPRDSESFARVDMHTVMEIRLGMSHGPAAQALL